MLERERETIRGVLVDRTIGERKSYHLEEALKADIPRGVKTYLQAEVERWLERDLRASQTFARVDDQATPYVDHVTATFLHAMSVAYSFTRDQFLATLENGIHFTENYLCRPRWTLENFLFDEKDVLLLHELRSKLKYLADYRYFSTILERVAREREWSEIHGADIRPLIRRIDNEVVRRHGPSELPLLAKPIYEFLLLGEDPFSKPISTEPLLMFFKDKGLDGLVEYVEKICHIRQRNDLTLGELIAVVEDFYPAQPSEPEKPPAIAVQQPHAPAVEPQPEVVPSEPRGAVETQIPEEISLATEPEVSADVDAGTPDEPEMPQISKQPPTVVPPQQKRENAPLTLTYAGLRHPVRPSSYPDLLSMVDETKRHVFVKKLFANDDAYYTGVMTALNSLLTWKEASLYLSNFYDVNGLDPYADEVIEFTDLVHQRFTTPSQRAE